MALASRYLRASARWTLIWALACSVFVSQNIARDLARGRAPDPIGSVLLEVLYWVPWLALTPLLLYAARRWPLGGQAGWRRAIAPQLGVMVAFGVVQVIASDALQFWSLRALDALPPGGVEGAMAAFRRGFPPLLVTAFWKYWVFVGLYHAFDYHRRLVDREVRTAQLERELARAQLQALEMQLHPHFLFNTLHSISMLNFVDVDAANRVLVQLSDLLRLTLEKSGSLEVPLAREIDFIDRYLAIERVRFEDRLEVRLEIADEVLDAAVPNLLIQPLVENAIRHGIAPVSSAGRLTIRGRRGPDAPAPTLVLEVEDDGPGLPTGWSLREHSRIGLANVRDRIARAYGDACALEFERGASGTGTLVRVTIPYRVAAAMESGEPRELVVA